MATRKYLDYEGLTELVSKIKSLINQIGHVTFKGVVSDVSSLPALSGTTDGYMYMITTAGETTSDFVEGAGIQFKANTEVVRVTISDTPKWALLGTIFDVDDRLQFGTTMPSTPSDGDTFLYTGPQTYKTYTGTLTALSDPNALGLYEQSGSTYALTADTEPETVYKAWSDGTTTYFTTAATPAVGDTVYTVTGGAATDSGYTVTSYDDTNGITVNSTTYARVTASDVYIAEKVYYEENLLTGVIYVYDSTGAEWNALSSGDGFTAITNAEVDALFD